MPRKDTSTATAAHEKAPPRRSAPLATTVEVATVTPLEVQLATMRTLWGKALADGGIVDLDLAKEACALAKDTTAFLHPRLASVDHSGDMKVRHEDWLDSLPD